MVSILENIGTSPLKRWIRDHLDYPHAEWCLIWPFASKRAGYGAVLHDGKAYSVHRVICEIKYGPAPEGFVAAHSCGRGHDACVNPHHLSWKSPRDNQLDRTDGRGRRKRTKITPEIAEEIRSLAGRETADATAKRFDLNQSNVRHIQAGRTWVRTPSNRAADLTTEQAVAIWNLRHTETQSEIARRFGIDRSVVARIHSGQSYVHAIKSAQSIG